MQTQVFEKRTEVYVVYHENLRKILVILSWARNDWCSNNRGFFFISMKKNSNAVYYSWMRFVNKNWCRIRNDHKRGKSEEKINKRWRLKCNNGFCWLCSCSIVNAYTVIVQFSCLEMHQKAQNFFSSKIITNFFCFHT